MRVAMVVRNFSCSGGLELYTHKLVEGLLAHDLTVTVFCTDNSSQLEHPNLKVQKFKRSTAPYKAQRLIEEFNSLNELVAESPHFDIRHSQHQPMQGANVVTFHNHTVQRLSQVGLKWERVLNSAKSRFVPAYHLRNHYDKLLFETSKCCIYTSGATRDDFTAAYSASARASEDAGNGKEKNEKAESRNIESGNIKSVAGIPQVVVYPGSDLGSVSAPAEINAVSNLDISTTQSNQNNTFLFVGQGYRKKGLDVLLAACARLKSMSVPFKLLVAGLPKRAIYEIRLKLLGLTNEVEFLGFQSSMVEVYRQCSYFVMPSRVEPFGMAAIQAMKYGLVPIVSKVSGVSEILTHEHDALILQDYLSASELASLMARLAQDKGLTSRLSQQAAATASELTWNKTVDSTLNAYELVLQQGAITNV